MADNLNIGLGGGYDSGLEDYMNNLRIQSAGIKIYTPLVADDMGELKTSNFEGLFTGGTGTLAVFYTSSAQSTQDKQYYLNLYNEATSSSTTAVQFSVSFGNINGSGSSFTNDHKPSQAIYKKYANLLLESGDSLFTFNSGSTTIDTNNIFVLNFKRNAIKDKIDPANWQLTLVSGSNTIKLVDDSGVADLQTNSVNRNFYNIVSGTLVAGQTNPTLHGSPYHYYGHVFPELGILLLNGNELSGSTRGVMSNAYALDLTTGTSINNVNNFWKTISSASFRSEEELYSKYYFVRAKSKEYNFSSNPSYTSGSLGQIISNVADRGVPFSYVTGIGLYNDSGELLAVAKTSQPIFKEPGTEINFKIRIDF